MAQVTGDKGLEEGGDSGGGGERQENSNLPPCADGGHGEMGVRHRPRALV